MATAEEAAGEEATREFPRPAEARIVGDVLARLGRPDGLHSVQVRHTHGQRYRVNVYVRAGVGSCRVAHSFFVEADETGHVVRSSPDIARAY